MSLLLYNLFLLVYRSALHLAAIFNPKARLWVDGRKNWQNALKVALGKKTGPIVWMHCASLGEFEQGRPLLEFIRSIYPGHTILVTFFSPSGYEIRKNYPGADITCYLPLDGARTARKFIEMVQPVLVLWIRYEFWYYYLHRLKALKVPVLLVSGLFRGTEPFFHWYGKLHRYMLSCFTHLFVQNEDSVEKLRKIGSYSVSVSGDTRYDRVSAIAAQFEPLPLIEQFINGKKAIVAGSTWPEDEEELDHFANSNQKLRFIIAPHEIGEMHLKEIEQLFAHSIRYSHWVKNPVAMPEGPDTPNVLIIDNIGMLAKLYYYASVAYIGGGFGGDGLHNILEAAVYGVPVIYGPVYEKFPEAVDLIAAGGSFTVESALELEVKLTELLEDEKVHAEAARAASDFVKSRKGATALISNYIQENRLITN
ncbi:3-deoxy-D-manno-octulosonic acid transferase [Flavihumibacter profundi]|uniref:3-deoxy-D-manno-octulosonic acid transferase n=1 Tax=Flavihumibacter profundi TaxID=2716883 RepID=UPI001CC5DF78|nr:glycosyltransferase N-terminal domain-containing protein [Flavihumibacter profundi]MBZ5859167.1 3-deoxy-D-manno-octulosonic acid transferase [Flavihumibacter profundi]